MIDLMPVKPAAPFESHRINPKLCLLILTFHMNVRRLIPIIRIEEESVRSDTKNRWHNNEF
jgi:hypothetical protein